MNSYSLNDIKKNPLLLTYKLLWNDEYLVLRPLEPKDVTILANFLSGLSLETRKNYILDNYEEVKATEFCSSIAAYDKLRFLLASEKEVVGLFEFSLDIPSSDIKRLAGYEFSYDENKLCRFGPCLSDFYQGRGLVKAVFPFLLDITKKMGNEGVLLWGGVLKSNINAIKFYESVGFKKLGEFINGEGNDCMDMILSL